MASDVIARGRHGELHVIASFMSLRAQRSNLTKQATLCPSALVHRSPQRSCDVRYVPEATVSDQWVTASPQGVAVWERIASLRSQ